MNFDVLIPAHAESIEQLTLLIHCITFQKTATWKLKDVFLCSDNAELENAFGDLCHITFIHQEAKRGKPNAFNSMLSRARSPYCIQISADCLPASELTFMYLLEPLKAPNIGAVTSKPVPFQHGFMWLPDLIWRCHEFVQPKLNAELFSFKRELIDLLPETVIHDDAFIHSMLVRKSCQILYEPRAVVFNSAPKTLGEFYEQRKKNVIGNIQLGREFREFPPRGLRLRSLIIMSLELLANAHGRLDYARRKIPKGLIGYSLESTKEVFA
jgi:cellulose synthase/poly-beta-1,6-N-acetylglucosamine synthase-like glycosyltransferase